MENNDLLKSQLEIDSYAAGHLAETARWGKFLSIAGFIFTGLVLLLGLYLSVAIGSMGGYYSSAFSGLGPVIGFFYIAIGAVYFFPCLFLFRFSTKMKTALTINDQETLNEALNQQRRMFKFVGILTIIALVLYALVLLLGGAAAILG